MHKLLKSAHILIKCKWFAHRMQSICKLFSYWDCMKFLYICNQKQMRDETIIAYTVSRLVAGMCWP